MHRFHHLITELVFSLQFSGNRTCLAHVIVEMTKLLLSRISFQEKWLSDNTLQEKVVMSSQVFADIWCGEVLANKNSPRRIY